jgi:hypothetical protein
MSAWALRRRAVYVIFLIIALVIIFYSPIYNFIKSEPSCFDGRKNGREEGVDCGGGCEKVCQFATQDPIVLWSRSFEVRDGVYSSMAMIENPNIGTGSLNVPYTFRLFDNENVLVYERKGVADIPAQARFPVFESSVVTGNRKPTRTFFEFGDSINWIKQQESQNSDLRVGEQEIRNLEVSPRIDVSLENRGFNEIKNLEVFIVVYNMVDNAMGGSRTVIESITPDTAKTAVFTWPNPFSNPVGRIEVIPKFNTK